MKIETLPQEDHQVKLTVEIDPEQLEAAKHKAAREIAKTRKIPGFRPGKAPYAMVERFVGPAAILEEAVAHLVDDIYPEVIKESGIKPYGPGRLEKISSSEPPIFEFVVPLEATVEIGDYRAVRVPYEPKPVTDEDVEKVIQDMREQQAVVEPVDRPAQEGDEVSIKVSGERTNPAEEESTVLVRDRSMQVVLKPEGEQNDIEWPFPGFNQKLVGVKAGEAKDLPYTFNEESPYESLRGKEAVFHVTVETVKRRTLPELNKEFIQSQGEFEDVDAMKADIRKQLEEQARTAYDEDFDERVYEEIKKDAVVKYAPQMLDEEKHSVYHSLENSLARQGMEMETYLKMRKIDQNALMEELTPTAQGRLERMLILFEIGRKENIKVTNEEVQQETLQTLNMLSQQMDPKQIKKTLTQNVVENLASNITMDRLLDHTRARLRLIARGEEIPVEAEEAEEKEEAPASEPEPEMKTVGEAVNDEEETPLNPVEGESTGE